MSKFHPHLFLFFHLISIFIFPKFNFAQDELLWNVIKFTQSGDISPEFWKFHPAKNSNQFWKTPKKFKKCPESVFRLIKDSVEFKDGRTPKAIDAINQLQKMGLIRQNLRRVNINVGFLKKFSDRYYMWASMDNFCYLIDKEKSFFFCLNDEEECRGECLGEDIYKIESLDKDKTRLFINVMGCNGRFGGRKYVCVTDIDYSKESWRSFGGQLVKDLDGDKQEELIIGNEMDYGLDWFWVYKFENNQWIDASDRYPQFYKTYVVDYFNGKISPPPVKTNKKMVSALKTAAENGGPSFYLKRP